MLINNKMSYRRLDSYGSTFNEPEYSGIEYDFEVPDNVVISSPGGVSSTHHHWTKEGLYSNTLSTKDIYAGEGEAYPYGEYGNIYQKGESAPYYMGEYGNNPDDNRYLGLRTGNEGDVESAFVNMFPETKSSKKENFTNNITENDKIHVDDLLNNLGKNDKKQQIKINNPFLLFFIFLLAFVAFTFWGNASVSFISQIHKSPMNWKDMLLYAIFFTVALFVAANVEGIPFVTFENI